MGKISPTQTFKNVVQRARDPLPQSKLATTFRKPFSLSLQVELCELMTKLHRDHRVNLSQELEPLIKRRMVKLARQINETAPRGRGLPCK
jgi:hypothetical protein